METHATTLDDDAAAARRLAAAGMSPEAIRAAQALVGTPAAILAWVRLLGYARPSDLCRLQGKSPSAISRQLAPLLGDGRLQRHHVREGTVGRPADVFALPDRAPPTAAQLQALDGLVQDVILVRPRLWLLRAQGVSLHGAGVVAPAGEPAKATEEPVSPRPPEQAEQQFATPAAHKRLSDVTTSAPIEVEPPGSDVDHVRQQSVPATSQPPWHAALHAALSNEQQPTTATSSVIPEAALPVHNEHPVLQVPVLVAPTVPLAPSQPSPGSRLGQAVRRTWDFLGDLWWMIDQYNHDVGGRLWPLIALLLIASGLLIAWPLGLDRVAGRVAADISASLVIPTEELTTTPMSDAPTQARVIGTGGAGLVVRDTTSGQRIGKLAEHTLIEIIGGPVQAEDNASVVWWRVRHGKLEGWVSGQFLSFTPTGR